MRSTVLGSLTVGTVLLMAGCTTPPTVDGRSASEASMEITRGMTYAQVLSIAEGFPMERTFNGRGTALQFCSGDRGRGSSTMTL